MIWKLSNYKHLETTAADKNEVHHKIKKMVNSQNACLIIYQNFAASIMAMLLQ
jgi:hypothetical protein